MFFQQKFSIIKSSLYRKGQNFPELSKRLFNEAALRKSGHPPKARWQHCSGGKIDKRRRRDAISCALRLVCIDSREFATTAGPKGKRGEGRGACTWTLRNQVSRCKSVRTGDRCGACSRRSWTKRVTPWLLLLGCVYTIIRNVYNN